MVQANELMTRSHNLANLPSAPQQQWSVTALLAAPWKRDLHSSRALVDENDVGAFTVCWSVMTHPAPKGTTIVLRQASACRSNQYLLGYLVNVIEFSLYFAWTGYFVCTWHQQELNEE